MPIQKLFAVILSCFCLAIAGCSDDDDNDGVEIPVEEPTEGEPDWEKVYTEEFTDMIVVGQCEPPFKFEVDTEGSYRAGPCEQGGSFKRGKLTRFERTVLDQRATAVVMTDLSEKVCEQGSAVAGTSTDMRLTTNQRYEIYRDHPDTHCFRGNLQAAQSLHAYMSGLSDKYYPVPPTASTALSAR